MRREQQLLTSRHTLWWQLTLLLMLIVYSISTTPAAAQDTALQDTGTRATAETEVAVAEETQASTEASSEESGEQSESGEKPTEQPAETETQGTGEETEEQPAAEDAGESSSPEQSEPETEEPSVEAAEASEEDANKETQSPGDEQADVETERATEVDPPKEEPKAGDQESKSPEGKEPKKKCIIGATATLLEKQSELKFRARVDTGAKSCSLHVEEIRIKDESKKEDEAERMTENIGKIIHFKIKNGDKKTHILSSKIAGYVLIKNSNKKEPKRRYKVPLTFRWKNVEKEVLVTLNNRNHMEYPLLIGRNFLRDDFLVDVTIDSDD